MLKNVTITLEEDDLQWARQQAAERETSVSRLVGEIIRKERHADPGYWEAYRNWKARSARGLDVDAAHRLTREEANERSIR